MPLDTILDRRLLIISGKGGVGKTSIAAALSILLSRQGKKVLLAEVEGKGALSSLFGSKALTHTPAEIRPGLFAVNISAEKALEEYFEVQFHMKRIARPLISSQLVYYVTHAAPGLRDILMLGKVWHDATTKRVFDVFVLDTPAAGHAVSMLRSPEGFLHAVPFGPLANHTRQLLQWLRDSNEVSVQLVSMAEEMPVNETIETTRLLEQKLSMDVTGIFLNMLYPAVAEDPQLASAIGSLESPQELVQLASAAGKKLSAKASKALFECADFYNKRREIQLDHRQRLIGQLSSTAKIVDIPFIFSGDFGIKELDFIADVVEEQIK